MAIKIMDGATLDIEKAIMAVTSLSNDDIFNAIVVTEVHSKSQIKVHMLKIEKEYLAAIKEGIKKFEIRLNDRNFQIGDILLLHEKDSNLCYMCGVTYITDYEQKEDYVVMSIVPKVTMTTEEDIVMFNYIKQLKISMTKDGTRRSLTWQILK